MSRPFFRPSRRNPRSARPGCRSTHAHHKALYACKKANCIFLYEPGPTDRTIGVWLHTGQEHPSQAMIVSAAAIGKEIASKSGAAMSPKDPTVKGDKIRLRFAADANAKIQKIAKLVGAYAEKGAEVVIGKRGSRVYTGGPGCRRQAKGRRSHRAAKRASTRTQPFNAVVLKGTLVNVVKDDRVIWSREYSSARAAAASARLAAGRTGYPIVRPNPHRYLHQRTNPRPTLPKVRLPRNALGRFIHRTTCNPRTTLPKVRLPRNALGRFIHRTTCNPRTMWARRGRRGRDR